MKTNFYIKDNRLIVEVVLDPMNSDPASRVRFGMPSLMEKIKDFKLPDHTSIGKCLTPVLGLDNYFFERQRGTWVFELLTDKPSAVQASETEVKEGKPKKATRRPRKTKSSTRTPRKK